jgi:hypothetical protein
VCENEISKETDIRQLGAICLSCGHPQCAATEPARARHMLPIEWALADAVKASRQTTRSWKHSIVQNSIEAVCEGQRPDDSVSHWN